MKKHIKQLISAIVAAAIMVQSCPLYIFAEDIIDADDTVMLETGSEDYQTNDFAGKPSENVVGEVSSQRQESIKHFKLEDGSFIAVNYGLPVHYSTDGETWEDIDNTLTTTASGGGDVSVMSQEQTSLDYTAENGDRTTTFSSDLSEGFLFSSSRGQVGIRFSLPGDSTETNEDEIVTEDSIVELVPIESEPQNPSSEEEQESTSVTLETEASEEPAEETVEATEEASEETTEATEEASEETTEATEETEEQEEDATVATVEQTEVPSEENNEANPEMATSPAENEEITYVDETTATATGTTEPDTVTQEPVQTEESSITIEDNLVVENTESLDGEDVTASDNTEEGPDMSEPETKSDPTEGTESETETQPIEEMPTEATEPNGTTETIPSATDGEDISSEITEGDVTEPTEESVSVEETEPSQESTAPTEPSDNTEETVSLDETIPSETEEVITETEEITNEETDFEIRQFDRTVVAQISYPDQEGTEVTTGNTSTMGIQQGDSISDEENPDLMDQIYPEKLRTNILYEDVYPGVDLLYEMYSVHVKESIIVKEKLDDYSFTFQLSLTGLTPISQDDGGIKLIDENDEEIYWIPAPYMKDAYGEISEEVSYSIEEVTEDIWELTVTSDPIWIEDSERVFPIEIDPTLIDFTTYHTFNGTVVTQNSNAISAEYNLACGYHPAHGQMEIYYKINQEDFPTVPEGCTIVRALAGFWEGGFYSGPNEDNLDYTNEMKIFMSPITSNVDFSSLTWNNRPSRGQYLDYQTTSYNTIGLVGWDVTREAKKWYSNSSTNLGLALTSNETSATYYRTWFAYNKKVFFIVAYRNTIGVEPYYTYQTLDVGKAGTAYIGDFSGNLTVNKQLVYYASAINPVSIELNYNSFYPVNYDVANSMGYEMNIGYSMQLNLMQRIDVPTIAEAVTSYLRWTDGDGTQHYFAKDLTRDNIYFYDEDGLGLKIKILSSVNENYEMSDDDGNTMTFTNGLLTSIKDANGNQIKINLSSGKITSVTQLNNTANPQEITIATFSYNDTNTLTEMVDAAGNQLFFNYSGGYLVSIKKPNEIPGEQDIPIMRYSIPNGTMNFAFDYEARYGIAFEYAHGKISKYWEINETAEYPNIPPVVGAVVAVEHTKNGRVQYRHCGVDQAPDASHEAEKDDIITSYSFDYAGRSVNCYSTDADDNLIGATNAVYSGIGTTAKDNNRTMRTASTGAIAVQLLTNAGFESGSSGWNVSTGATIGTTKPKTGAKGYIGTSSSATASRTVSLASTGTYTISGYVNTSAASFNSPSVGVYIEVLDPSGKQVAKTNLVHYETLTDIEEGWVRVSDTFPATVTGNYTVTIRNNGVTGYVYVDDLLLEAGEATSALNLLEGGDFANGIAGWENSNASYASNEGMRNLGALRIDADPNWGHYASKTVELNLPSEQTYVLSGWAKANAAPCGEEVDFDNRVKLFGLRAKIVYSDNYVENQYVLFCPDIVDWQFASLAVVPKKANEIVKSITVVCDYAKNVNYALFDDLSLTLAPAQTMEYDLNGELESVATSGSSTDTYSYSGSDLIEAVTEGSSTFNYTYDTKHNLKTATNGIVTQSYSYSSAGNLTSTTLTGSSGSEKITSSATYSTDGNQLTKATDSRNYSTTYAYEQNAYKQHGIPTQVTDALGTERRTIIDSIGRPTSEFIDSTISLTYAYTKGMLSQVSRGGWLPNDSNKKTQNYNLAYDSMNRLHKVDIGTRNMVTNTYNALSFLTKQTFGNTQSTTYTYDDLGRVKTMTQADGAVTTYSYSSDGKLSMIESGSDTYRYVYDSLNRLISSDWLSSVTTKLQTYHQYDTSNRLTKQAVNLVDKTYTEIYNYDDYGRLSSMTAGNGGSISLVYDDLSRVSTVTKPAAKAIYTYLAGYGTNVTTGLVSKLEYKANGNSFSDVTFSYAYDALGNITSYTDSSKSSNSRQYVYDAQGQLTEEKTSGGATVGYYTYDTYGNIRSSSNGVDTIYYTYGNTEWLDLLTAYNGQSITYDTIGNPTSYYNGIRWNFDWRNGRELYQATKNVDEDTSVTVNYDYDMNGLRTGKTVVTVTQGSNGTHSYTSTVVAPTCTTGGYTLYQCACGASYQNNAVAALGHSYTQTSTSSGVQYTCSRCGDSYMDHAHSYTDTVIAPTCTEGGYTLHECSCGYSYQDSPTAARGHFYNKIGETYICTRCGHSYSTHTHSYTETIVSPTCTEGGYTLYECTCGYSYQGNATAARGHFYNPTTYGYICTRCGHTTTTLNASAGEYELSAAEKIAAVNSDICPSNSYPDVTETVTYSYIYAGGKLIRQSDGNATLDFLYDQNGNPYAMSYKANPTATPVYYYYILNLQGDVVRLVTANGATAANYSYNAWGKCTVTPASSTYTTVANANPLRYRGYYYDSETGFYYVSSRYYDPAIGRFINADDPSYLGANGNFISYNLFAYCGNNPVNRRDIDGAAWETIWDAISLGTSIAEVAANPYDPWAWIGLAGDTADILIPFIGGIGETTRALKAASQAAEMIDTASDVKKGWRVGEDITNLTKAGNVPSWSTMRSRYWKNKAHYFKEDPLYTAADISRMEKGLAPQFVENGRTYSMELHHMLGREGNNYYLFFEITPQGHSIVDQHRYLN